MKKIYKSMLGLGLFIGLFTSNTANAQCTTYSCGYNQSIVPLTLTPVPSSLTAVVSGDDNVSGALPIGFTFNFMCTAYTNMYVTTNGFITFNAGSGSGCCSGGLMPTGLTNPSNLIALGWSDLNTSNGGTITVQTIGISPNRICVVTYSDVVYHASSFPNRLNGQIKLFETSNNIELHVATHLTPVTRITTEGIQDASGTVAFPVPGRNSSNWNSTGDAYRFTPFATTSTVSVFTPSITNSSTICAGVATMFSVSPVAGATAYNWSLPAGWVGTSTNNTIMVTPNGTSNSMSVTATFSCGTSAPAIKPITVSGLLAIVPSSTLSCSGSSVSLTASAGASSYTWNPGALNGGSITVTPTTSTIYTVTGTFASGCVSNSTVSIAAGATPTISVNSGAVCAGSSFTMSPSGASTYTFSSGSAAVTPTANTSYSVTGTSSVGCVSSNTAVSSVTLNALPTVSVNSGAICSGSSFTMAPTGTANTYSFSGGSAVVSPTASASYTVTGTNTVTSCFNTAVSSVSVNATPVIGATTSASLICSGQTATLNATGATTYTWAPAGSGSSITITPSVTTSYTVSGTNTLGCTSSATVSQAVSPCTGISNNQALRIDVKLFPNPTTGLFNLELNTASQVSITNILGQVILVEKVEDGTHTFNLQNQSKGLYFVKISQNNKQETIKIVVE